MCSEIDFLYMVLLMSSVLLGIYFSFRSVLSYLRFSSTVALEELNSHLEFIFVKVPGSTL